MTVGQMLGRWKRSPGANRLLVLTDHHGGVGTASFNVTVT